MTLICLWGALYFAAACGNTADTCETGDCDGGRNNPTDCNPADNECDEGLTCSITFEQCVPTGTCGSDLDCGASESCSNDEQCEPRATCSEDDDCSGEEHCSLAGYCVPADECRLNADCGASGLSCTGRTCTADLGCSFSGDCGGPGFVCDVSAGTPGVCVFNEECGDTGDVPAFVEAPALIVLDRSCSMQGFIDDGITANLKLRKWEYAVDAVNAMLGQFGDNGKVGMVFLPDPIGLQEDDSAFPNCEQEDFSLNYSINGTPGRAHFPAFTGEGNAAAIRQLLTDSRNNVDHQLYPDDPCATNIYQSLLTAAQDPAFEGAGENRYMILITDGHETCNRGRARMVAEIAKLHDDHGVTTFVLGFGDRSKVNIPNLNAFAIAGGAPVGEEGDTIRFHLAETGAQFLEQALNIADQVRSCSYTFEADEEPSKTDIGMYLNADRVPLDETHENGWDMVWSDPDGNGVGAKGTGTVTFYGNWCDELKNGDGGRNVAVFLGCPALVVD